MHAPNQRFQVRGGKVQCCLSHTRKNPMEKEVTREIHESDTKKNQSASCAKLHLL